MVKANADTAITPISTQGQDTVAQTAQAMKAKHTSARHCALNRPRQLSSVSVSALAITPSSTGISSVCQSAHQP
jgi:hypothetical protein